MKHSVFRISIQGWREDIRYGIAACDAELQRVSAIPVPNLVSVRSANSDVYGSDSEEDSEREMKDILSGAAGREIRSQTVVGLVICSMYGHRLHVPVALDRKLFPEITSRSLGSPCRLHHLFQAIRDAFIRCLNH